MYYCSSYPLAVAFCVFTMLCWGSWGNAQKLAGSWPYRHFYWDFVVGMVVFAALFGFTAESCGEGVTIADSGTTWCCDMYMNNVRLGRKASSDGWFIPWVPGVAYYDAAVWAKRIPSSCRTNITRAGLGDYCCPPMGLAKLWNNIPGNKSIKWVQGSEHGYVPPEHEGRDFIVEK